MPHNPCENAPIKIAFFDVDGTLVSFKTHGMPESTRVALRELRRNGIKIFVASGRALFQLPDFLRNGIGDFEGFDGFLCNSGQVCLDDRGIFRMTAISPEDVAAIADANERGEFDIVYMLPDRAFTPKKGPEIVAAEEHANVEFDLDADTDPRECTVFQMNAFLPAHEEHRITDIAPGVKLVRWTEDFCDIIPATGGKDLGVQAVLEHNGLSRCNAMAFGDGGNDATMLSAVGMGVAMGNADWRAKRVADMITTSVDDSGIYRACVALGLIDDVLGLCGADRVVRVINPQL